MKVPAFLFSECDGIVNRFEFYKVFTPLLLALVTVKIKIGRLEGRTVKRNQISK
jgi:hypothetical protein